MKRMIAILISAMLLVGCNAPIKQPLGKKEVISYEHVLAKLANKESFIVFFSQAYCSSCQAFDKMLQEEYLVNHKITLYEVDLEAEAQCYGDEWESLFTSTFQSIEATPAIYYIDDQQNITLLPVNDENISEKGFNKWVQSCQKNQDKES